jgi:hypothetical protein
MKKIRVRILFSKSGFGIRKITAEDYAAPIVKTFF